MLSTCGTIHIDMLNFNVLILDDDEERLAAFRKLFGEFRTDLITTVGTADEAIHALLNISYNIICLDHDLTLEQNELYTTGIGTGVQVASFLAGRYDIKSAECLRQRILIHSTNSRGAVLMYNILDGAGYCVRIRPYLWKREVFYDTFVK